ncbi:hypothetical protein [Hymenobacter sp. YC55]|uniref:SPW repeat domain-containing protein n=1 Tax=Hymenobacter sp. YC55 TaxID=3034019 RepID=UPI0023F780DA|nr:hypothetical protein [Hymenobacter sp. YC55]MDF7813012.1 hypothetical protein [Hymenobacter sp. YC55]
MKILSPTAHGVVDVMFITVLAMAPIVLDLEPAIDTACFVMAGGYLVLTLLTDFKLGLIRIVPLQIHGWLDLMTGVLLLAAPFLFKFPQAGAERGLFWLLGAVSVITWFITDWKAHSRSLMTDR